MKGIWGGLIGVSAMSAAGCVTVVLAPGADQVRETTVAADVADCRAVGNVHAEAQGPGDLEINLKNRTLGLGGNVLFVTNKFGAPSDGVAYRCASPAIAELGSAPAQ